MRRRFLLYFLLLSFFLALVLVWFCNHTIEKQANGKLYSDVGSVPFNKTGLLLGTSKYLSNGTINLYYKYRIDAALQLLKAGKIRYLVISGDNSTKDYNEPALMRADLMAAGVDSTQIFLDYAGFRTFDSMVRLREIFGQKQVTVISQPFHNARAVYIGSREGIVAIGFNARDVGRQAGFRVQLREKLARVNVFLDGLTGKKPRYLGERIQLPD